MRAALFLFLLLTAVASQAQPVAPESRSVLIEEALSDGPSNWQQVGMVAGGAAGSVLLVTAASPTAATVPGIVLTVVMLPVGSALGVHLAGRALGVEGSFQRALIGATVGSVIGIGTLTGLVLASEQLPLPEGGCDFVCPATLLAVAVGAGVAVAVPAFAAASQYPIRVAPIPLATPTGDRAPGLSLRLAL